VARFNDGVQDIADIRPGMLLQGTVSNVAQFGAFVDLGVHQDGLIHVSQMRQQFVADAREVVKTGQSVKVKVLEVDAARGRISLSMRLDASGARSSDAAGGMRFAGDARRLAVHTRAAPQGAPQSAMASAFAKLQGLRK